MNTLQFYVWYDVDASPQEHGEWETLRKLMNLGDDSNSEYVEIFNAFELIELEKKLESEGWAKAEYDESVPLVYKGILTVWEKRLPDN